MMDLQRAAAGVALVLLSVLAGASPAQETEADSGQPKEVGLVEETGRRLLQLDVTVRGPAELMTGLSAEDFELFVDGRAVEGFIFDPICVESRPVAPAVPKVDPLRAEGEAPVPVPQPPGMTLLFYFDQYHLTFAGRERSIETARQLVRELVVGSTRATIVSSGQKVETFAELTSDQQLLLDALDRLAEDATQLDSYANLEDSRVDSVYRALATAMDVAAMHERAYRQQIRKAQRDVVANSGPSMETGRGAAFAQGQADLQQAQQEAAGARVDQLEPVLFMTRELQREEQSHTEKGLARFAAVLDRLADVDPPKATIYFGDRLRSNPGDHYGRLLNTGETSQFGGNTMKQITAGAASSAYEGVVDVAASYGVRLYTVQAEGLVPRTTSTSVSGPGASMLSGNPLASAARFKDAENGLAGFALETGGQVFLGAAARAGRIAEQIRADLTCVYLLTFEPGDLPEDRALPVRVALARPGLETRYRSRLFVESAQARKRSRLRRAFYASDTPAEAAGLRVVVVPTGFESGKFTALVQAAVPGSPMVSSSWEIGITVVYKGKVREERSGKISVNQPGVPIVFETSTRFAPGPYEVTAVAAESATGQVISRKVEGEWPDPNGDEPAIGPIALLQPAYGAFLRDDASRKEGSLGHGPDDWVRPDRPTALVALACRGRSKKALAVERKLEGASVADFEPIDLDDPAERCSLLVDMIQANTMTSGLFEYGVDVLSEGETVARRSREFLALTAEEIQLASETE